MLTVNDHNELLALNKALMYVRYLSNDMDPATRGSALLSELHARVIEEIIASARTSGRYGEVTGWEEWRALAGRKVELPMIVEHLSRDWARLASPELKRDVVRNQLRPFNFSEDDVERLVQELDRRLTS